MMHRYRFDHIDRLTERQMREGIHMRLLAGDALMFSVVRFEPHSSVPTHQHPHEQIGYVIEGELELWIGDDRRTLRRGDMYTIASNVPHGAQTGESTCVVLDAFTPLREDYVSAFRS
ncbi:MAG TPA: cupin domain-containing protein [bacterium]|nr:cupin domain-containing protein [bacterium]